MYPSNLVPADPAHDPAEWELRMQQFRDVQRQRVLHRMQQRQLQVVQQATTLVRHAEAIVTTLRTGRIPDPWAATPAIRRPSSLPPNSTANSSSWPSTGRSPSRRACSPPDELEVHLAIPASEPSVTDAMLPVAEPTKGWPT